MIHLLFYSIQKFIVCICTYYIVEVNKLKSFQNFLNEKVFLDFYQNSLLSSIIKKYCNILNFYLKFYFFYEILRHVLCLLHAFPCNNFYQKNNEIHIKF
jgi:hypothetical protein